MLMRQFLILQASLLLLAGGAARGDSIENDQSVYSPTASTYEKRLGYDDAKVAAQEGGMKANELQVGGGSH
jgi:hypothetical protein